jgi:hypothetical protein
MGYSVVWSPQALNQLAAIWLASTNRDAVTAATNAIDVQLENDPHLKSQMLPNGLREIRVSPLRAQFGVDETNRLVGIMRVTTDQPLANFASPNGQAV